MDGCILIYNGTLVVLVILSEFHFQTIDFYADAWGN